MITAIAMPWAVEKPGGVQHRRTALRCPHWEAGKLIAAGVDLPQSGGEGLDLAGQAGASRVGVAELVQPAFAGRGRRGERTVLGEHHESRGDGGIGQLDLGDQQARPNRLGQVRSQAADVALLFAREHGARLPVQTDIAPADAAHAQHRAQLVGETQRGEDVAMAGAGLHLAARRLGEGSHTEGIAGQRGPFVDVVLAELVLDEVRDGLGGDVLLVCLGEEQRRRVDRRPEGGVERHGPVQPRQDAVAQSVRRQARAADLDDRPGEVLECHARPHFARGDSKCPA